MNDGDLISRKALLGEFEWLLSVVHQYRKDEVQDSIQRIKNAPAVDAVELPCKIGDVVYSLYHGWRKEDGIVPYQITNLTITQNKKGEWKKKYRAMWLVDGKTRDWSLDFGFDEIGKKAFLTREAAEAAINKKEKENEVN